MFSFINDKIIPSISLELKGMRIYKLQLVISLFVMPLSVLLIMLFSNGTSVNYTWLISGFIVASIMGSTISMLSMRVSNLVQPEILELYSTFLITKRQLLSTLSLTYALLSLPQIMVAIILLYFFAGSLRLQNPFKASGIVSIISYAIMTLTPFYYVVDEGSNEIIRIIQMFNPFNCCLVSLRAGLYPMDPNQIILSYAILAILSLMLSIAINRKVGDIYILEKFI